jgi:hypothetical protein
MSLGVNVARDGGSPLADLKHLGSKWNRIVAHPDAAILFYLKEARSRGMKNLLVLDHDSALEHRFEWREAVSYWKSWYAEYADAWQVLNEPDAGWDSSSQLSAAERAPDHPSSWCMDPDEVTWRLREAREVLGPDAYIVGPGLSSGQPEYSDYVDWSSVNGMACHPYAKQPGSIDLNHMISSYKARAEQWGIDLFVTEYDSRTPGMSAWMASDARTKAAFAFCYSDDMVFDFGLVDRDGWRKKSYYEFQAAANADGPKFQLGFLEIATRHPDVVGAALENETGIVNGNSFQATENGWLYWGNIVDVGDTKGFLAHDRTRYLWNGRELRRVA